jgi:hypothetical protein
MVSSSSESVIDPVLPKSLFLTKLSLGKQLLKRSLESEIEASHLAQRERWSGGGSRNDTDAAYEGNLNC